MRHTLDRRPNKIGTAAAAALIAIAVLATSAVGASFRREVKFARGKSSATVEASVVRGDRDLYFLGAKKGQSMEVRLTSIENNAVFELYQPGATAAEVDGGTEVKGKALPQAGPQQDATAWKGKLPVSGKYLIVVGGTRGNATYKLKVGIR